MGNEQRETRIHGSVLAAAEKRLLVRTAAQLPRWVTSDHLTALGAIALLLAGICYAVGRTYPGMLVGVVVLLAVNWFGDSLDGTVARVRHQERPRYGFYVDHVLDAVGILLLIGGLMAGGFMSLPIGMGFLVAYYLLTIEIALATHALGTFRLAYWKIGPTELRILLAIGTLLLLRSDSVVIAGERWLLFDVGGAVGIAGLVVTFLTAAIGNTRELYRREPLPAGGNRDRDRDRDNGVIHHRGNGANGGSYSLGQIHRPDAHLPIS
jgi:phosphatidylglycerophosphate synthase